MNDEERRLIAQQTAALERLNGALAGFGARQDYSNLLLLRMVLALGIEPPEVVKPLLDLLPQSDRLPAVAVPLGRPISKANEVTTTSQTYVDLVKWEIPAQHTGELFEVSMATTEYTRTHFRLILANEEQWTDKGIVSSLTQRFRGNRLTEKMIVLIQAKSTDGELLTVRGSIAGKLIPPPPRPQPER